MKILKIAYFKSTHYLKSQGAIYAFNKTVQRVLLVSGDIIIQ